MHLAIVIKYCGILLSAASGLIALLGDPRKDGRLTKGGRSLILFVIIGAVLAIVCDQFSIQQTKTEDRIKREWSNVKDERIKDIEIQYLITGEASVTDLLDLCESFKLSFYT